MIDFTARFGVILLSLVGPILIGWAVVALLDSGRRGR